MVELEEVIEKRIKPIVDKAMHKWLGVTVSEIKADVSDKLKKAPLLEYEISTKIPFKKAKKLFKKLYLSKLLSTFSGNITDVAEAAGLDRRSVHRLMDELKLDPEEFRGTLAKTEYVRQEAVKNIIQESAETYKSSLSPTKFKEFYEHVPELSRDIVKELPTKPLTLKQAEREFEKSYLRKALKQNKGNISQTAKKIGLRFETLHRKLKALNLA
jgi:DNA-binding NtrC family response regulator